MDIRFISSEEAQKKGCDELFKALESNKEGLRARLLHPDLRSAGQMPLRR